MKLSQIISLVALASGSIAAPLVEVISGAIQKADKDTLALNAVVKGFNGDIKPVTAAANTLIKDVQDSKSLIDSTPGKPLDLDGVVAISGYASQLWTDSGLLVESLAARKGDVEKGNYCSLVQEQTKTIYTVSIALIDTITGRVGDDGKSAAEAVATLMRQVLQKSIDAYASCKDANPTTSSSATTATSTTSATTSSPTGTTSGTSTGTSTGTTSTGATSTGTTATGTHTTGTHTTGTHTTGVTTSSRWNNGTTTSAPGGGTTVTTICTTPTTTAVGGGCKTCPGGGSGNGGSGNGGSGNGGSGNGGSGNGGAGNGGSGNGGSGSGGAGNGGSGNGGSGNGGSGNGGSGNGSSGNGNGGSGNGNGGSGNGNSGSGSGGKTPPVVTNSGNLMAPAGALALAIAALVM